MPTPEGTTPEVEPKVEEQGPVTASPVEGETQEQRGDETPEAQEVTFQQLQEDPRYKEDWDNLTRTQKEAREASYREGQSAAGRQLDADKKKWAAEQQALATFDSLEKKWGSEDPSEKEEFGRAMRDPKVKESYELGLKIRQGPSHEQIETELIGTIMGGVDEELNKRLSKQGELSKDEEARVDKGKFKNLGQLVSAKVDLLVERETAAGVKEASEKHDKEVADTARQNLLDELGLEYSPDEIRGRGTKTDETAKHEGVLAGSHSTGEEKISAFEKKHGYPPRGR